MKNQAICNCLYNVSFKTDIRNKKHNDYVYKL